jgi:peptide chain release factor 1
VAVLREPTANEVKIDYNKLEISTCRGSGAGGQKRNKTESTVQLRYEGIIVRCESERSQSQNKESAMSILLARLWAKMKYSEHESLNSARKGQIGLGQRGDKIRTIRVFDNIVIDHNSEKRLSYNKYEKGQLELLYETR